MQTTIKVSWRTPITHPQNSTNWNVEEIVADPDRFDSCEAEEAVRSKNPSLCGDGPVDVGSITYVDDGGEVVTLQQPNLRGAHWAAETSDMNDQN